MDWKGIDLNLLVVLQSLLDERSVTRAGEALGLSQPAMSAALGRLRTLFGDPLFVRAGREMQPTPRAQALAGPVRQVLETVRGEVLQGAAFEPATSTRRFTLVTPDVGELCLVAPLVQRLRQQAPQISLRAIARTPHDAADALESGEADLAVGHFPDLQRPGYFQQKLADIAFVGLLREDHPHTGTRLTRAQLLEWEHALVRPDGRGRDIERAHGLAHDGLRVAVEVAHFVSLLPILAAGDLVSVVPEDFARFACRHARLRTVELTPRLPPIGVYQFWHQRMARDAGLAWLRGLLQATARELDAAASPHRPSRRP
ncbi:MAG: hypothetical protein RLY78_2930 [Pseudomonadota bacterium]|jgi:DNA-binding transcriptional LysR family regulator|uniref:LysR family transcriptional regulator n=1 Tax=Pseudaquabacterium rugosum TaxID=2984194 RepID=A0ABU9BCJ3_9BURK